MTPQDRRRYLLWHLIERHAYCPSSSANQRTWCTLFVASLSKFWGVDPLVVDPVFPRGSFPVPGTDFAIEYDLSNWAGVPKRASVRIRFKGVEVACHHIDHAYKERMGLLDPPSGKVLTLYTNKASQSEDVLEDVRWVLDCYVIHPCAHVHPSPEILANGADLDAGFRKCLHEVRLGTGFTNPFAALFQYRVNLVLGKTPGATREAKRKERDRVAALIQDAVLKGTLENGVSAGKLFGSVR